MTTQVLNNGQTLKATLPTLFFCWASLVCATCLFGGCRSAEKFGTDSYAENNSVLATETALASSENAPLPGYAQTMPQGDESKESDDFNIQLASAKTAAPMNVSAAAVKTIPLRTLGSSDDFEQIIQTAPGTVLVDFYADWCGPCRKQGKVLHSLESFAAANQAQIIKVDVDQHKAIAKKFDVSSLPTLVVIKNGKVVDQKVGLTNESRLRTMMQ